MRNNRLTNVNELCRPEFCGLEILDIGNNKITEIPVAFVHFMSSIQDLIVSNNEIRKLPPLLGYRKSIKKLAIDGNPMTTLKRQIILNGTEAIM